MIHHPRGDDRVIAGERAGHVLGAFARCRARPRPSGCRPDGRRAGRPPSPSSCGCAPMASGRPRRRPCPPAAGRDRSAPTSARISASALGPSSAMLSRSVMPVSPCVTMVPMPSSVSTSISKACGTRPSMMWAEPTPPSTASAQARSLGIMPARHAFVLDPLAKLGRGQARGRGWSRPSGLRAGPARRSGRRSSPPASPPRSPSPPRRH